MIILRDAHRSEEDDVVMAEFNYLLNAHPKRSWKQGGGSSAFGTTVCRESQKNWIPDGLLKLHRTKTWEMTDCDYTRPLVSLRTGDCWHEDAFYFLRSTFLLIKNKACNLGNGRGCDFIWLPQLWNAGDLAVWLNDRAAEQGCQRETIELEEYYTETTEGNVWRGTCREAQGKINSFEINVDRVWKPSAK